MGQDCGGGTLEFDVGVGRRGSVASQIHASIRQAILGGVVESGERLPSVRALATQLGVARGTVQDAYRRLMDERLVVGAGAAGTRVRAHATPDLSPRESELDGPLAGFTRPFSSAPRPFQMGVPAHDAFPAATWTRVLVEAARRSRSDFATYSDPRGEPELRGELAAKLALSRQLACHPDQIVITTGYRHGLQLVLSALGLRGRRVWMEDPGYPLARRALELCGSPIVPVPVDDEGLCVDQGRTLAPDAAAVVVTPGQQAPLGVALSPRRRAALLGWADDHDGWIIEDDYLGELQLEGRAAPALASGAGAEHVIHIGSFRKTLSPTLGLGYVVAPRRLTERLVETAAVLAPAPGRTTQLALAEFSRSGRFLRHLRRMKSLYAARRDEALSALGRSSTVTSTGLGLQLHLPSTVSDVAVVKAARALGLAPTALSPWFASEPRRTSGLLLSITNLRSDVLETACRTLETLVREATPPSSRRTRATRPTRPTRE